MTGLDKMISQIQAEAKAEAESRLAAAREEAEKLTAQAAAEGEAMGEALVQQAEEDASRYLDRVRSSADMKRRMAILQAKQEVIAEVLEKAYERLDSLDEAAYFDLIRRLLAQYAQPLDGEICFRKETGSVFPPALRRSWRK